jgi:hypothetical protein
MHVTFEDMKSLLTTIDTIFHGTYQHDDTNLVCSGSAFAVGRRLSAGLFVGWLEELCERSDSLQQKNQNQSFSVLCNIDEIKFAGKERTLLVVLKFKRTTLRKLLDYELIVAEHTTPNHTSDLP